MIISISNAQSETISAIAGKASSIGRSIFAALTSEKAQQVYRSILTTIALVVVVIAIGLGKAAQYYWSDWIKPGAIVISAYGGDKIRRLINFRLQSIEFSDRLLYAFDRCGISWGVKREPAIQVPAGLANLDR